MHQIKYGIDLAWKQKIVIVLIWFVSDWWIDNCVISVYILDSALDSEKSLWKNNRHSKTTSRCLCACDLCWCWCVDVFVIEPPALSQLEYRRAEAVDNCVASEYQSGGVPYTFTSVLPVAKAFNTMAIKTDWATIATFSACNGDRQKIIMYYVFQCTKCNKKKK